MQSPARLSGMRCSRPMALISAGSRCAICREQLAGRALFATSGVWLPNTHRLYRYCDAAMHRDCYATWPDRLEFERTRFEARAAGARVFANDDVLVFLGRLATGFEVRVFHSATASTTLVPLEEWQAWLAHGPMPQEEPHWMTLNDVLPVLAAELPTPEAIEARADWEPIRAREDQYEAAARADAVRSAQTRARYRDSTFRTDTLAATLPESAIECPHCRQRSKDHRYCPPSREPGESFFVCASCGRSFTADDCGPT